MSFERTFTINGKKTKCNVEFDKLTCMLLFFTGAVIPVILIVQQVFWLAILSHVVTVIPLLSKDSIVLLNITPIVNGGKK